MKEESEEKTTVRINPINWHMVWMSIALSEAITLVVSRMVYGELRMDLVAYGFFIPLFVAPAMIFFSHATRRKAEVALVRSKEELRKSLHEREMLMKEAHHRVKNNLGIIQSLLRLQLRDVSDEKSRSYFKDTQNRVESITMIHERLSRSKILSAMSFSEYVNSLTKHILRSYALDPGKVGLKIDIPEIDLDVDILMPAALIINELLTNALKYAFPGEMTGEVTIALQAGEGDEYTLVVRDDGIGMPEGIDVHRSSSLGLKIVSSLVGQLGGKLELLRDNGTEFRVSFKKTLFD